MKQRQPIWCVVVILTLITGLLVGCTAVPAATPSQAPVEPTDTVVYGVPTSPSLGTRPAPGETASAAPPAPETPAAPETRALDATRLTILHTNDTRGWLDPCG